MIAAFLRSLRSRIRDWYWGEYIPHENRPESGLVFLGGWYKRHWSARAANALVDFWLAHWKWIIGILVAVILAVISRA